MKGNGKKVDKTYKKARAKMRKDMKPKPMKPPKKGGKPKRIGGKKRARRSY